MKDKIKILYKDLDDIENQSLARFSYRERMKIERTLYIFLLDIVEKDRVSFNLRNKNQILSSIQDKNNEVSKIKIALINKIFELRVLIKALSTGNPYEKYDALYQIDTDRITVFTHVRIRVNKLALLADLLILEKEKNGI